MHSGTHPKSSAAGCELVPVVVATVGTSWLLLAGSLDPSPFLPDLRAPEFMARAEEGFAHIRNLDYDEAEQTFSRLEVQYPAHPAPPLYRATVVWLRELFERAELDLDRFVSPAYFTRTPQRPMDPGRRQAFERFIQECQARAHAVLDGSAGHADARYFLSASYGLQAAFTFTIDRSALQALKHGKAAYREQRALVDEHPEYYDAYVGVGLYEYVVASLPWYVKWLAALTGHHGSKERGMGYLRLATEKGRYVADDARVLLMVIFVRERRYEEALAVAQGLGAKFPRNYLFRLNQAQILERANRTDQAAHIYSEVVALAEAGRPHYDKIPLATFRYAIGKRLMELGDLPGALRQFERSVQDSGTPERERALAHLRAGQILDLRGQRDAATTHYHEVLRLRDVEGSHRAARRFLTRPYRAHPQ